MQSTSLTIEWHNWGLCSSDDMVLERTTISRAASTIHVKQFNGRQDLIHDELVRVNADEIHDLFVLIDQVLDAEAWIPDDLANKSYLCARLLCVYRNVKRRATDKHFKVFAFAD